MSNEDPDFLFAMQLQKELNDGGNGDSDIEEIDFKPSKKEKIIFQTPLTIKRSNPRSNLDEDFLNRTQNLVHPMWETLDPTPDVFSLFGAFDNKFFQGCLKCVTLEWSKRMYSCAGICYSRSNRLGMEVTIRLSEPLLKLRPRKDLIETMLHEMIHAYCFVKNIREGNGGHGPNFKKIMGAINKVAGTNITVYHTFHDEVEVYRQHWWRCNGSCQNRSPFFGYVKRTSNRAPSANDQWWPAHLESCGGTFMKIKGPEPKPRKASKAPKENKSGSADLRKFFTPTNTENKNRTFGSNMDNNKNNNIKGNLKVNAGSTLLLNPKNKNSTSAKTPSISTAFPPTSYPGLSSDPFNTGQQKTKTNSAEGLAKVLTLRDLSSDSNGNNNKSLENGMSGKGYSLSSVDSSRRSGTPVDRNHLRNIWEKRFSNAGGTDANKRHIDVDLTGDVKRRRLWSDGAALQSDARFEDGKNDRVDNKWILLDDEVMVQEDKPEENIIDLSSDDGEDVEDFSSNDFKPRKTLSSAELETAIKQEILDESLDDLQNNDIVLIDGEYDDNMQASVDIVDTSIIDEFFGVDTLLKEFNNENDVRPTGSRNISNPDKDIITCPICQAKLIRALLSEHLDGCMGISRKIQPPKFAVKKLYSTSREAKPNHKPRASSSNIKDVLRQAGYSESDLANITSASSADDDEESFNVTSPVTKNPNASKDSLRLFRQKSVYKTTRQCPKCASEIDEDWMNDHLDYCLSH